MNKNNQKPKPVKPTDTVTTLGIKVYPEQCPEGFDTVLRIVTSLPTNTYKCYAIVHDKEGKPHLHLAISLKQTRKKRRTSKVSTLLRLFRIEFRQEDLSLMSNRGLETLGSFNAYLRYLTHTDSVSLANPKKKKYELQDFSTNMDRAVFNNLLGNNPPIKKMNQRERFEHECREAKDAGYNLWRYDMWLKTKKYEFVSYSDKKIMKIKECFDEGLENRIKDGLPQIVICIYQPQPSSINSNDLIKLVNETLKDLHMLTMDDFIKNGKCIVPSNQIGVGFVDTLEPLKRCISNDGKHIHRSVICRLNKEKYNYEHCGGLTYRINIIDDPEWDKYIGKLKKIPFYYSCIDEENQNLIFKMADKAGTPEMQLDRKKLYTDFRDAFNYHLKAFYADKLETSQSSEVEIDYSDL